MQLVLLFSTKPVGKETFLEVSSPISSVLCTLHYQLNTMHPSLSPSDIRTSRKPPHPSAPTFKQVRSALHHSAICTSAEAKQNCSSE